MSTKILLRALTLVQEFGAKQLLTKMAAWKDRLHPGDL